MKVGGSEGHTRKRLNVSSIIGDQDLCLAKNEAQPEVFLWGIGGHTRKGLNFSSIIRVQDLFQGRMTFPGRGIKTFHPLGYIFGGQTRLIEGEAREKTGEGSGEGA